jgi:hypothetical protein
MINTTNLSVKARQLQLAHLELAEPPLIVDHELSSAPASETQ